MEEQIVNNFITEFIKIANKLHELEKIPVDFGIDETLYPSEIHTIDAIGDNCDTVTEISVKFGITKGAVSQIIGKLNKKGYVTKTRNKLYGKEINLSLSDKGIQAYHAHKELHKNMDNDIIQVIQNYSDESLQSFCDLINKIEKHIDKYIKFGR